MDANKLTVLRQIEYRITSCGACVHGEFKPGTDWGTCKDTQYNHGKHTESERNLSITRLGSCWKFKPNRELPLKGFAEFIGTNR